MSMWALVLGFKFALQRAPHARLALLPLRSQLGCARHLSDIMGFARGKS